MDRKYVIKQQGKDFVLYAGLIDLAHQNGISRIKTALVQSPSEANQYTAIVKATVYLGDLEFDGIGDASPASTNKMIGVHCIRMAETRAKARALRDALNIGETAAEELGGEPEGQPAKQPGPRSGTRQIDEHGEIESKQTAQVLEERLSRDTMTAYIHAWWASNEETAKKQRHWLRKYHRDDDLSTIPDRVLQELYQGWIAQQSSS